MYYVYTRFKQLLYVYAMFHSFVAMLETLELYLKLYLYNKDTPHIRFYVFVCFPNPLGNQLV